MLDLLGALTLTSNSIPKYLKPSRTLGSASEFCFMHILGIKFYCSGVFDSDFLLLFESVISRDFFVVAIKKIPFCTQKYPLFFFFAIKNIPPSCCHITYIANSWFLKKILEWTLDGSEAKYEGKVLH